MTDSLRLELPEVYVELLRAFSEIDPGRSRGSALAIPTLYAHLRDLHRKQQREPWSIGYVKEAIDQLVDHGVVEIRNRLFVSPSERGEELIETLIPGDSIPVSPPPFPSQYSLKPDSE